MTLGRRSILVFLLVGWMGLGPGLPARAQAPLSPKVLPKILEFDRKNCPVCRASERVIHAVKDKYPGQFVVQKYYIDEEEYLFRRYKVAIVPTQVFLDASGKEVSRHEGLLKQEDFIRKLRESHFIRD
jgi:thioredoxin 1